MAIETLARPAPLVSPTLAANERVLRLRREGRSVLHMGFGEAPFPVHRRLAEALARHANERAYLPVHGLPALREAVAAHQARLTGLPEEAYEVMIAPGSKAILFALQMAVPGDVLLPTPSWVSYRPQAQMLGRRVVPVPTVIDGRGLVIEPEALSDAVKRARAEGLDPRMIVLNSPSNPTGLTIPDENLAAIAAVCERHDILIVSDEIYARLAFDGEYRTIARHAPERTVVTTGLSKHLSLGGWRLGVGLVPKRMGDLVARLAMVASETWSCVAAPVQHAAVEAYAGHTDVEDFITMSRRIHRDVTGYAARRLQRMGVDVVTPMGGFYLWPDVPRRGRADHLGGSEALAHALSDWAGIIGLPGAAFGEAPDAMRLRLSACDYDGVDALSHYRGLPEGEPGEIAAFAPRVAAALDGFETFLADR